MEEETTPAAATNGVATNGGVGTMSVTATAAPVVEAAAGWQQPINNAVERANDEEEAQAAAAADADAGNIVYMDEVRNKRGRI